MDFSTIKITSKKVIRNTLDITTKKITSKKVRGNNVEFSTIEITSKKVRGNNVDFSTIKITWRKVRGSDVNFSISKITLKKYVNITWKFVQIWSSTYQRNIYIESVTIWRGVPIFLMQIHGKKDRRHRSNNNIIVSKQTDRQTKRKQWRRKNDNKNRIWNTQTCICIILNKENKKFLMKLATVSLKRLQSVKYLSNIC